MLTCRSMSFERSSTRILQPISSPKESDVRADDGAEIQEHGADTSAETGKEPVQRLRRLRRNCWRLPARLYRGAGQTDRRGPLTILCIDVAIGDRAVTRSQHREQRITDRDRLSRLRRLCRGCAVPTGCGAGADGLALGLRRCCGLPAFRCMSTLPRKCAPSAIATRGAMMSPSTEPPSLISTLSRRRHVAVHLAEHDQGLGEHLGLDLAVRPNGEHVVFQLDLAFDLTLDGQILTPVQLAFDDDRLSNIHDVSPGLRPRLGLRCRRRLTLDGRTGRGYLTARRLYRFITFPHVRPSAQEKGYPAASHDPKTRIMCGASQSPQSISARRKYCLAVLLLRLSANATMPGERSKKALKKAPMQRIYFDHNATTPVDPAVVDAMGRCSGRTSATRRASTISASGQRPPWTRRAAPWPGFWGPTRPRWSSPAGARRATTSPSAASPRRWSGSGRRPPGGERHRARGGPEHAQGAVAPGLDHDARAGRRQRNRRRRRPAGNAMRPKRRSFRSCTPTTRSAPSSRLPGAGAPGARARRAVSHRRGAVGRQDPGQRQGRWGWTCCRSRRTSSTGRRASARSGFGAGSGLLPMLTGGKHERSRRAGTENVAGICRDGRRRRARARRRWPRRPSRSSALRDRLEEGILARGPRHGRERRPDAARPEHDEHQLRSRSKPSRCSSRSTSKAWPSRPVRLAPRGRSSRRMSSRRWAFRRTERRTRSASASAARTPRPTSIASSPSSRASWTSCAR